MGRWRRVSFERAGVTAWLKGAWVKRSTNLRRAMAPENFSEHARMVPRMLLRSRQSGWCSAGASRSRAVQERHPSASFDSAGFRSTIRCTCHDQPNPWTCQEGLEPVDSTNLYKPARGEGASTNQACKRRRAQTKKNENSERHGEKYFEMAEEENEEDRVCCVPRGAVAVLEKRAAVGQVWVVQRGGLPAHGALAPCPSLDQGRLVHAIVRPSHEERPHICRPSA